MFHVALEDKPLIIEKDTRRVLWIRMKQNNEGKSVYQQGLLALHKVRQNGQQRITVQYVNVSNGSQPVIGHIDGDTGVDLKAQTCQT